MLDLLLLAIVSFLIARVIWNVFGLFQSFFSFISRRAPAQNTPQMQSSGTVSNVVQTKKQIQKLNQTQNENNKKVSKVEKQVKNLAKNKQGAQQSAKSNKSLVKKQSIKLDQSSKPKTQQKQDLFPIRLQQGDVNQKTNQKNEYQATIRELREEISLYQREKQLYIQRIEEIIQHIVNGTEQQGLTSNQNSQPSAINNLTNELNTAHLKIKQQKDILTKRFAQEKQLLIREYQDRIQSIQADFNQKTKFYEATINQVTQRIQELQARGNEERNQQNFRNQAENQRKLQQYRNQEQELRIQLQQLSEENSYLKNKYEEELNSMSQGWYKSRIELQNTREELARSQNDYLEYRTKYEAQIDSLSKHNQELISNMQTFQLKLFTIQQLNDELKSKLHSQQFIGERASKQLASLEQRLASEMNSRQELEKKLEQTLDELKFCQQQLNDMRQTETDLREKLKSAIENPKKSERAIRKEDIENSPQYMSIKVELQRLKRKLAQKQQIISRNKTPENQQRELSPSFPQETKMAPSRFTPSPMQQERKLLNASPYSRPISTRSPSHGGASTISQRRAVTPIEKQQGPTSTILQGGIKSDAYLGQTQILNEAQRNIIVHEVSAVKKITVKKTRLMFSLKQKSNKSIHEFILGAPNIILVAELENGKIVGAFTQNAFSRENKFTKSSIVSKAMIFDVSKQVFIINEGHGEIIRCQENALIWGNREFVVSCQEPISISVNLNGEDSVYPSNYSTIQFLDSEENVVRVSKLQIHRVFLG